MEAVRLLVSIVLDVFRRSHWLDEEHCCVCGFRIKNRHRATATRFQCSSNPKGELVGVHLGLCFQALTRSHS